MSKEHRHRLTSTDGSMGQMIEIVGTSDETIGNSAVGSVSSGNAHGETSPEGEINGQ